VKILLHSINYAPEITGTGKDNGEMGEWFAKRGHEVRAVTAPPYYPAWRFWEGIPIHSDNGPNATLDADTHSRLYVRADKRGTHR
jgi:hypothetical protein